MKYFLLSNEKSALIIGVLPQVNYDFLIQGAKSYLHSSFTCIEYPDFKSAEIVLKNCFPDFRKVDEFIDYFSGIEINLTWYEFPALFHAMNK